MIATTKKKINNRKCKLVEGTHREGEVSMSIDTPKRVQTRIIGES